MGKLESENAGDMVSQTAEKRMGTPEELGYAIAQLQQMREMDTWQALIYCAMVEQQH